MNKLLIFLLIVGIIITVGATYFRWWHIGYTVESSAQKDTAFYAYINNMTVNKGVYVLTVEPLEYLSQSECQKRGIDSPSGFCITNIQDSKEYKVTDTATYTALTRTDEGWGGGVDKVSFAEFFENFQGVSNSIKGKNILIRTHDENGLFKIHVDSYKHITMIEGVYTP